MDSTYEVKKGRTRLKDSVATERNKQSQFRHHPSISAGKLLTSQHGVFLQSDSDSGSDGGVMRMRGSRRVASSATPSARGCCRFQLPVGR